MMMMMDLAYTVSWVNYKTLITKKKKRNFLRFFMFYLVIFRKY